MEAMAITRQAMMVTGTRVEAKGDSEKSSDTGQLEEESSGFSIKLDVEMRKMEKSKINLGSLI